MYVTVESCSLNCSWQEIHDRDLQLCVSLLIKLTDQSGFNNGRKNKISAKQRCNNCLSNYIYPHIKVKYFWHLISKEQEESKYLIIFTRKYKFGGKWQYTDPFHMLHEECKHKAYEGWTLAELNTWINKWISSPLRWYIVNSGFNTRKEIAGLGLFAQDLLV